MQWVTLSPKEVAKLHHYYEIPEVADFIKKRGLFN
jgi:hypothetical protein